MLYWHRGGAKDRENKIFEDKGLRAPQRTMLTAFLSVRVFLYVCKSLHALIYMKTNQWSQGNIVK
jgi:hypothetical protein